MTITTTVQHYKIRIVRIKKNIGAVCCVLYAGSYEGRRIISSSCTTLLSRTLKHKYRT